VAYASLSTNLVAGDTNVKADIFVLDRTSGLTTIASRSSGGVQSNGGSSFPSLSADGRFVVFTSQAVNLVAGDTNGADDVFLRDRVTGQTERVSVASGGAQASGPVELGWLGDHHAVSNDGRFIAFTSQLTNLVPGDGNGAIDVFLRDRVTGTTRCISYLNSTGATANGPSVGASISADGRLVAFTTYCDQPGGAGRDRRKRVRVRRSARARWRLITKQPDGSAVNAPSGGATISADGRFVCFASLAHELVPSDANNLFDVYLHDRATGSVALVSLGGAGQQGDGDSYDAVLAASSSSIAFVSTATNLVAGDRQRERGRVSCAICRRFRAS
jgi:Tol biopolymer transport system component